MLCVYGVKLQLFTMLSYDGCYSINLLCVPCVKLWGVFQCLVMVCVCGVKLWRMLSHGGCYIVKLWRVSSC